jgi:hypothetical protein
MDGQMVVSPWGQNKGWWCFRKVLRIFRPDANELQKIKKISYDIHSHALTDNLQYNVQQMYIIATYEIYNTTLQLQHVSVHYGPSSGIKHINQLCIKYYS